MSAGRSYSIAIIDDEPSVLSALRLVLETYEARITAFSSPHEALQHLSNSPLPDAVLCDVRMPGMSGFEVLQHIRNKWPEIPVILMSAHASAKEKAQATSLGAHAFLSKPFEPDDLFREMDNLPSRRAKIPE